jgi:ABC-2 type transport system permease protein
VTALRNIGHIVRKEWLHYFASPIAYVALTFWAILIGLLFFLSLADFLSRSSAMAMRGGYMQPSINDWLITGMLQYMAFIGLFVTPMITMRLLAEEKRQGTMELLATSPITDMQVILGKFFGALSLYALMIATGLVNLAWLWKYAAPGAGPDWRPLVTGTLALLLLGACFVTVGLLASALTRNQIIAGVVAFAVLLVFWVLQAVAGMAGGLGDVVAYLGLIGHLRDMMRGVVDLKDVVYYLSFIFFGLFLAQQAMESHRWRA